MYIFSITLVNADWRPHINTKMIFKHKNVLIKNVTNEIGMNYLFHVTTFKTRVCLKTSLFEGLNQDIISNIFHSNWICFDVML